MSDDAILPREPMGDCIDLYIVGHTRDGPLKIGISKDADQRLMALQTGSPWPLKLFVRFCIKPEKAFIERAVHRALADWQESGEWFSVPIEAAMSAVLYQLRQAGISLPDDAGPVRLIIDHPEANRLLWR